MLNCLLKDCANVSGCSHCGFNEKEHRRRIELLRKQGLERGEDGLCRLVIRREAGNEQTQV